MDAVACSQIVDLLAHIALKNHPLPAAGNETPMQTKASQRPTDFFGGYFEHLFATPEDGVYVRGQVANRKLLARGAVASGEKSLQDDGRQLRSEINSDLAIQRRQERHDLRLELVIIHDRCGEAVRKFLHGYGELAQVKCWRAYLGPIQEPVMQQLSLKFCANARGLRRIHQGDVLARRSEHELERETSTCGVAQRFRCEHNFCAERIYGFTSSCNERAMRSEEQTSELQSL